MQGPAVEWLFSCFYNWVFEFAAPTEPTGFVAVTFHTVMSQIMTKGLTEPSPIAVEWAPCVMGHYAFEFTAFAVGRTWPEGVGGRRLRPVASVTKEKMRATRRQ